MINTPVYYPMYHHQAATSNDSSYERECIEVVFFVIKTMVWG